MTLPRAAFEARLRAVLDERYHDAHPFNLRMHEGRLSPDEIRAWVRNRYYYQTRIPIKDGLVLAKAEDPAFRRAWVGRLHDHDGSRDAVGGLELWLRLADAVGLDRDEVRSLRHVLPGVRDACDDYVRFVESHDLLASVAASLTELAAGDLMRDRIAAFEKHYPWVDAAGLRYFHARTTQAPRDGSFGLGFVLDHAKTAEDQERCVEALVRKCGILWRLLDAVEGAERRPRVAVHALVRKDPADGRTLVVLAERAVRTSGSADEILALCDGVRSREAIARELAARHADREGVWDDVHRFLDEMERLGVLECAA